MRKIHHIFPVFVLMTSASVPAASAEFVCSSELSYQWTSNVIDSNATEDPSGSPGSSLTEGATPANTQAVSAAASAGSASVSGAAGSTVSASNSAKPSPNGSQLGSPPGVRTVKFALLERRGADEHGARTSLLVELQRQKLRAAERCKRAHESFGECVTTKLSTKSSTLNSLSFSARTQAEQALMEECKIQQGRCLAVEASEPSCREVVVATTPTAAVNEPQASAAPDAAAEPVKEASEAPTKQPPAKAAGKK